jgi:hypothetical protein
MTEWLNSSTRAHLLLPISAPRYYPRPEEHPGTSYQNQASRKVDPLHRLAARQHPLGFQKDSG